MILRYLRSFCGSEFSGVLSTGGCEASTGRQVAFRGQAVAVQNLAAYDFAGTDILFLSTGGENAKAVAPRAAAAGCVVIDNSSAFRMEPNVPLVVPEVNLDALGGWAERRILPVANCSTIQLVVALKPLHDAAGLKRVVVSTYQSAAGGGRRMLERLMGQADPTDFNRRALSAQARRTLEEGGDKPVAFNVVPHTRKAVRSRKGKAAPKLRGTHEKYTAPGGLVVTVTASRGVTVSEIEAALVHALGVVRSNMAGAIGEDRPAPL